MLIPPKNPKLKIAILSYRSAPFGGGQGIVTLADDSNHSSEICKVGGSIAAL